MTYYFTVPTIMHTYTNAYFNKQKLFNNGENSWSCDNKTLLYPTYDKDTFLDSFYSIYAIGFSQYSNYLPTAN